MKGKKWFILLPSLVIILLASSIGVTRSSFVDLESSTGNTFQAWTSRQWVQTTEGDFNAGVLNNVDTSSSPGNVTLGSVYTLQEPTTSVGSEESWYADWSYRKKITIDHTQVDANLTDFPVLISLASDSGLASHAQSDGDDILFTSSNGTTKLSHEIEGDFDSATGKLVAWVKVLSLSSSTDTDIYMYYGNSSASNQQNVTGTWDSSYVMVQHMDDLTTSSTDDSTSNNNDGTKGAADQPLEVDGKIGRGQDFTPTTQYIQVGTTGFSASSGTLEAWVKAEGFVDADPAQYLFGHTVTPGWSQRIQLYTDDTLGNLNLGLGDSHTRALDIQALNTATWYHIVLTWDGTNYVVYVDSVSKATGTYTGLTSIQSLADIGNTGETTERIEAWDGIIDEVRISATARSAEWIATEYNNQDNPSAFYSVGSEESWYYTSWSRRAPVTINNPGSALTDYQVRVDVTYDADMQPDFDDIRFRDSDGLTELAHWRESYIDSTSAIFWVKVPSVPSGNKTIYMYYGNAAASSASDGNATFLFYDDFEEHAIGEIPDGWTMYPGCSGVVVQDDAGNKVLDDGTGSGGNVIAGDPSWTDIACRQRFRSVDDVVSHAGVVIRYTDEGNEVYGGIVSDTTAQIWDRIGGTWTQIGGTWTIPDVGTSWHVQELRIAGDTVELYIDDNYIGSGTLTSGAPTSGASGFWCQYSHQGYRDEHIVRKCASQHTYVSSGTIASQVLDTGVAGARWDALFWDEILPSNTDITFEVRASDTLFAKDALTPSWTSVGGASPVTSGLPSERYMQWRATLTTSDTSNTPILQEVRVYHY